MTEHEFRLEVWRHVVAIMRALAFYWFGKRLNIGGDPPP